MAHYPLSDFAVSTVTFHEQMLGIHAYINHARNLNDVVKGYEMMGRLVNDFKMLPLVSFDAGAATKFEQLQSQRILGNWLRCSGGGVGENAIAPIPEKIL
jgi:tRNA(fMet)-specific endonuclease VapC